MAEYYRGLQLQLVRLLAGLLEVDKNNCIGFDGFFANITNMINKNVVTVFDSCGTKLVKIYCDPGDK